MSPLYFIVLATLAAFDFRYVDPVIGTVTAACALWFFTDFAIDKASRRMRE